MKVLVINNDGGGFADYLDLSHGTTVRELFERQVGSSNSRDYLIRVNRQHAASGQILCEGDRVSITPTKIHGAHC